MKSLFSFNKNSEIALVVLLCTCAALLTVAAVYLSDLNASSEQEENTLAAAAVFSGESLALAQGAPAPGSTPSPLKCLSPQFYKPGDVFNGASYSDLCAPKTLGLVLNVFSGQRQNGETIYLNDVGSVSRYKDCTNWTCSRYQYLLSVRDRWQQTPAEGGPIVAPGEPATLEWSCQPYQEIGYPYSKGSAWGGSSTNTEVRFEKNTYADRSVGTWQSWAGTDTFTAGPLQGSTSVSPANTTNYTLTCATNRRSDVKAIATVYVDNPVLSLEAVSSPVAPGTSASLNWAAHNIKKPSCTITSENSEGQDKQVLISNANASQEEGTFSSPPLFEARTFRLTCQRYSGLEVSISKTVAVAGTFTVTAPVAKTVEGARNAEFGLFRITRTGTTTQEIQVSFSMSGTAVRNKDYTLDGGVSGNNSTVRLRRGVSSVDITVRPRRDDRVLQPTVQAIMTLTAYPSQSATVTIEDNETPPPDPEFSTPPTPPQISQFYANPSRVAKGERGTIHWNVEGVDANTVCYIKPAPAGGSILVLSGTGTIAGSQQTGVVNNEVVYTLSCGASTTATPVASRTLRLGLIPGFQEI